MNDTAFATQIHAILLCLDVLGLGLLLALQFAAWRRSGQRSLLALAVSTGCVLVCLTACSLGPLLIRDQDLLGSVYLLGEVSALLQLLSFVGGSIVLTRHYLELLQAPHATPAPRAGLLQSFGLSAAGILKAINWFLAGLGVVIAIVVWLMAGKPDNVLSWLLIIPAGLMLRALRPHGQGAVMHGFTLLINLAAALGGWTVFLNCLINNPEPIRGSLLSLLLAAAPFSANSVFLVYAMRRGRAA